MPKGGIVGIMVDAFSGSTGAVFARLDGELPWARGSARGTRAERELVHEEVSRNLEPGVTIVIAETTDPDPGVLDAALAALGGGVRRAARDVFAELQGR